MSKIPKIKRALISVSEKSGIVDFAKQLIDIGIEILATGGTAKLLAESSMPVTKISDYINFPEILGGRVKTLHPKIYGALLALDHEFDQAELSANHIESIDLVVVNLYPFQQVTSKPEVKFSEAIENIDIGGPCMIRASAKNAERITVIVDPTDYKPVLEEIHTHGNTCPDTRSRLARKAFALTADYDKTISTFLTNAHDPGTTAEKPHSFPTAFTPNYIKNMDLRYGENPHQLAAVYKQASEQPGTLAAAKQLQGKPLSYNNLLDADAALECVRGLNPNKSAVVIVKHCTPCGAAEADSLMNAYQRAYQTDSISAFGGIIACNQPLDHSTAEMICQQQFAEVIIAPQIKAEAIEALSKKPNIRVLAYGSEQNTSANLSMRTISGGLLVQDQDIALHPGNINVVTKRKPSATELEDLLFAWAVVCFTKSNGIVLAKELATVGIGSGQTSRIFSTKIAVMKADEAKLATAGAVMASDAFFPFADSIETAHAAGITAIIQPGGSRRDAEVIAAADKAGMAMLFTATRHFRH